MKTMYSLFLFCIGFLSAYLLFGHQRKTIVKVVQTTDTLFARAVQIDSGKSKSDAILVRRNSLLAGQLLIANQQISRYKDELKSKRNSLHHQFQSLPADTSVTSDSAKVVPLISGLDELDQATDSLLGAYEVQHKLCEAAVAVKDSQIVLCNRSYRELYRVSEQQSIRQQQLETDLATVLKQHRKVRRRNRLLGWGATILSGAAATLLIHRNH